MEKNLTLLTWKHFFRLKYKEITESSAGLLILLIFFLAVLPYILGSVSFALLGPEFFADCDINGNYIDFITGEEKNCDPSLCSMIIESPNKYDIWDRWATGFFIIIMLTVLLFVLGIMVLLIDWLLSNWRKARKLAEKEVRNNRLKGKKRQNK